MVFPEASMMPNQKEMSSKLDKYISSYFNDRFLSLAEAINDLRQCHHDHYQSLSAIINHYRHHQLKLAYSI